MQHKDTCDFALDERSLLLAILRPGSETGRPDLWAWLNCGQQSAGAQRSEPAPPQGGGHGLDRVLSGGNPEIRKSLPIFPISPKFTGPRRRLAGPYASAAGKMALGVGLGVPVPARGV